MYKVRPLQTGRASFHLSRCTATDVSAPIAKTESNLCTSGGHLRALFIMKGQTEQYRLTRCPSLADTVARCTHFDCSTSILSRSRSMPPATLPLWNSPGRLSRANHPPRVSNWARGLPYMSLQISGVSLPRHITDKLDGSTGCRPMRAPLPLKLGMALRDVRRRWR